MLNFSYEYLTVLYVSVQNVTILSSFHLLFLKYKMTKILFTKNGLCADH